jgi:tRNA-2-methylthio-N6-dimethylallyladenosine synthase
MNRVRAIKKIVPGCGISSDIITGFCGETEEDHQETLSLLEWVRYDMSYMFYYSERPGTLAARKYTDDVDLQTKKRRLQEVIHLQNKHSLERNQSLVGKMHKVLVEKLSKRSSKEVCGRNDQNIMVVFPKEDFQPGDYANVLVDSCTGATLLGKAVRD